jgi:hypothetical protein
MPHVARLAAIEAFDPATVKTQPVADGITIRLGQRHGSKTVEGIAYEFASPVFTAELAREWLMQRAIALAGFDPEPEGITLETDGTYTLRGIECAEEGTWYAAKGGKVSFTADLLNQATENTNAAIELLRPAFTFGHGEQPAEIAPLDGQPRLGFATKFYRKGKKVLCDMRKVPAVVVKALRSGAWGRISPTLLLNWPDPNTGERRPIVFQALALLGATPPAISTLQDLSDWIDKQIVVRATEPSLALSLLLSDVVSVIELGTPAGSAAADSGNGENSQPENGNQNKETIEMTKEEIIALCKQLIAEALASGGGGESEEMKQAKAELAAARAEMYTERLTRAATDGKMPAGEIPATAKALLEMSAESAKGMLVAIEAREPAKKPTGPAGNPAEPPADPLANLKGEEKLIALACKIVESEKIEFRDAWIRVGNENPEEYAAYRKDAFPIRRGNE